MNTSTRDEVVMRYGVASTAPGASRTQRSRCVLRSTGDKLWHSIDLLCNTGVKLLSNRSNSSRARWKYVGFNVINEIYFLAELGTGV